jgi:hypothetical protein
MVDVFQSLWLQSLYFINKFKKFKKPRRMFTVMALLGHRIIRPNACLIFPFCEYGSQTDIREVHI